MSKWWGNGAKKDSDSANGGDMVLKVGKWCSLGYDEACVIQESLSNGKAAEAFVRRAAVVQ